MRNRTTAMILFAAFVLLMLADATSAYYSPRLGRFLNRDPIKEPGMAMLQTHRQPNRFLSRDSAGRKDGQNTYEFVENNPLSQIDPHGLQVGPPKAGMPHCKLDGQYVSLSFNGAYLANWEAVSGEPVRQNAQEIRGSYIMKITSVFQYDVERQTIHNVGPIPEGGYWFNICEERDSFSSPYSHIIKSAGWGYYSYSLHAWPTTRTYGRSGFFIHGGTSWGSAGCIDLRDNDVAFHEYVGRIKKQNACCCYVNVNAGYSAREVTKTEIIYSDDYAD